MLKFNPIHLAAAVAIALSGPSALAQTTGGAPRAAPSGAATTTGTASTTASTGAASTTSTTTTGTTPTPGVRDVSGAGSQSTPGQSAGSNSASSSGSAMGTNQTTVDPATTRPGSFEPGGAFGPTVPGSQDSTVIPGTVPGALNGTTGAVIIPGEVSTVGNPSQQTIVIQQPMASPEKSISTPLLDQTTREAQARETRRRNTKQEPRIIGIAPNTDRDLTNQMPDDRIIRY